MSTDTKDIIEVAIAAATTVLTLALGLWLLVQIGFITEQELRTPPQVKTDIELMPPTKHWLEDAR